MEPFELGWVVGIVEGEGWFGVVDGRPKVTVSMTDEDTVRRLEEVTGLGHVRGPVIPTDGIRKPYWSWNISARDGAATFLERIHPHMSARRRKRIAAILAEFAEAGPTRGTAPTCGKGHDITPESGNLRLITDKRGYVRRRCLKCAAERQRKYRKASPE